MTRFVHLTDLHISDPATDDPHLYTDTVATLDRVKGMIARIDPEPAFVAVSGDLTNHGDAASYHALQASLARIGLPVVLALGNHDRRAGFRAVFDRDAPDPDVPVFHHARHGRLHVIALDSSVPGRVGGAIGDAQFAQLAVALDAHPDFRKLILCHHPPAFGRADALGWESLSPQDSARLADALAGHDIAAILSGHVHLDRVMHWQGVPVVVNTGLHNGVDVLEPRDMVIEPAAGFALCDLLPGGLEVTFVPVSPARPQLARIGHDRLREFS